MTRTVARFIAPLVVAALAWLAVPACAAAALTPNPTSLEFGNADIHSQNSNGAFLPVTLTNDNAGPVTVTSVMVTGESTSFPITSNGCTGAVLGQGQNCQVQLHFTPTALGPIAVSISGRSVGSGHRVVVSPRTLASFGNGARRLRVTAGGTAATGTLALATCNLGLEVTGGPGRSSVVAVSARYGVRSIAIRLSGLRLRRGSRHLGQLVFDPARRPLRRMELTGPRSTVNGVTVVLGRGRLLVTGLPPGVGVVRFRLRAGVLNGSGGSGVATATLRGATQATSARAPAAWRR